MPQPERVIADMRGSNQLDTAARQVAALNRLKDVVIALSGTADAPGGPRLTTEELNLNGRYAGAASSIYMSVYRSLDPDNKQQFDKNSSRNRWNRSRDRYYNDDAFISALLQRYLTPDSKEQYLAQLGQTRQKIQAMRQHTQGEGNFSDQQSEPSRPFPSNLNFFGVLGVLVLLTLLPRRGPLAGRMVSGWGRLLRYATVLIVCLWALVTFIDWPPDGMAFFAGMAALFVLYLIFRPSPPVPGPSTIYGTAHYAAMQTDIRDEACLEKGLFFGKSCQPGWETATLLAPGAPVCSTPEHHTLIVARTRTGKGTRVIIPTLLRYRGSALVIDPKGENAAITATARKEQLGQSIHILNPWNELAQIYQGRGFGQATYNPLDILDRNDPNVVAIAQTLAGAICPAPANAKDRFWQGSAANVLTAVFLWLADQPGEQKTLARAREIVSLTRKDFTAKYLIPMAVSKGFEGAIREMAAPFIDLADETYSGVMSNLSESTKFLSDPQIKAATAKSSFAMADLATRKATVFVVIPTERMDTQKTWLRLVIASAMHIFKHPQTKLPFGHRCLFLIDEFAALGRLDDLPRDIATMSGFGVDFALIVQGLDQLKDHYAEARGAILSNCAYKWFCNVNDLDSAKYLSDSLGKTTVRTTSTSRSSSSSAQGGGSSSSTVSHSETGRSLLNPDEVLNLGRDVAITIQPNGHPHYLRPIDYWDLTKAFVALQQKHPNLYRQPPLGYDENPYFAPPPPPPPPPGGDGANGRGRDGRSGAKEKEKARTKAPPPPPPPPRDDLMTEERARDILGVERNASPAEIRAAYLRLMNKVHPDHGGSSYFSKELNAARDLLLGQ
jgi:type IV secretory pathway TraG/TraD family ATPase VirD4